MSLSQVMEDPRLRELLHKKTTNAKAASREEAKLAQLVLDFKTPLYPGCKPNETRLSFTLNLMKTKARYKWSDASLSKNLKYLQEVLPEGNSCPRSIDDAKKSCAL